MRVNGTVRLDLTAGDPRNWTDTHAIERLIQEATYAPPGADIIFVVRRGQLAPLHGIAWLREHGQHLGSVTVECTDPDTITRWVAQLRPEAPQEGHLVSTGAARP
ncbi:hypothetical protein ACQBAT_07765 [Ornithinimicrobium sp. Y1847]|uniref:hypothetical protein n=1 Tax=unclassified Ornithinimicrobium TaxID=2615080 RepID=UPI003B67CFEE